MSGQNIVKPNPEGIAASINATKKGRGLPPVQLWNPPFCGDIDMRIARDGTWFYEGSKITRPSLVGLFSSILKLEDGKFFLVTPVEKVGITVDDAPFVAVDFEQNGADIVFETQVGDSVTVGPENAVRIEFAEDGEPSPYLHVRAGLEALIDRKSFYRLVEVGAHHEGMFGIWSDGAFFPFVESAALQE